MSDRRYPASPGGSHIHGLGTSRDGHRSRRPSVHSPHGPSRSSARPMPMAIGRARPASPPPPLPPPTRIKDLEDGRDIAWQWGNRGHPHAFAAAAYPSTGPGGRPSNQRRESGESAEYEPLGRKDSTAHTAWPPHVDVPGTGSSYLSDEGYGSLSGSSISAQLHSERQLERQNRKDSAHAYDNKLLSTLGWPKTPTQLNTADSTEGSPTSRRESLQSPRGPQLRNLTLSERSLSISTEPLSKLNSPLSSKWEPSPQSAFGSPGFLSAGPRSQSFADVYPRTQHADDHPMTGTGSTGAFSSRPDDFGRRVPVQVPTSGQRSESTLSLQMHAMHSNSPSSQNSPSSLHPGGEAPGESFTGPGLHALTQRPSHITSGSTSPTPTPPSSNRTPPGHYQQRYQHPQHAQYDPIFSSEPSPSHSPPTTTYSSSSSFTTTTTTTTTPAGTAPTITTLTRTSPPPPPPPSSAAAAGAFPGGLAIRHPTLEDRHPHLHTPTHPSYPRHPLSPSQSRPTFLNSSHDFSVASPTAASSFGRGRADSASRLAMPEKRKADRITRDATTAHNGADDGDRAAPQRKPNHLSTSPASTSAASAAAVAAAAAAAAASAARLSYASSTSMVDPSLLAPTSSFDPNAIAAVSDVSSDRTTPTMNIDPGLRGTSASMQPSLAAIAAQATSAAAPGGTPAEFSQMGQNGGGERIEPDVHICDCCPKKPKKFQTLEELQQHQNEKQYYCRYCHNRFKNKNEAERHQNSLHLRRQSWSCAVLDRNIRAAFHPSTAVPPNTSGSQAQQQQLQQAAQLGHAEFDICGYCGMHFPNDPAPDWVARSQHLTNAHKFGECNQSKKFFRADHFRQHLKHSHSGQSGKWTNMLENACMREEPPLDAEGQPGVEPGMRLPAGGPANTGGPAAHSQAQAQAAQAAQQQQQSVTAQLQAQAQLAAQHVMSEHQLSQQGAGVGGPPGMAPPALSMDQAAALANASGAPLSMMGGPGHPQAYSMGGRGPPHDPALGFGSGQGGDNASA